MKKQTCFLCDEPTGRTTGEDSIICELCDDSGMLNGPFCEDCWDKHKTAHKAAPKMVEALTRIVTEAALLAKNCPPAPHACSACEIEFVAREALKELS